MAEMRLYSDLGTGGLLARSVNDDDEQIEVYKSTPTLADPLVINYKNGETVEYWYKAPRHLMVRDSHTEAGGGTTTHKVTAPTPNPDVPLADTNTARSMSIKYESEFARLEYGYGLDRPEIAAADIDLLLSTGDSLRMIADYDIFKPDFNVPNNRDVIFYPSSDIDIPAEVGRLRGFEFYNGHFYIVGAGETAETDANNDVVHKLFKFKYDIVNGEKQLVKDGWDVNPQIVQSTRSGKAAMSWDVAVWNGYIYIADGTTVRDTGTKALAVHRLDTGAREGNFTINFPGGFPQNGRAASASSPSGVMIDQKRNRMLVFFQNSNPDEFIISYDLRDRFLDADGVITGNNTARGEFGLPAGIFSNEGLFCALDNTDVLYTLLDAGTIFISDLETQKQISGYGSTNITATAGITMWRGCILIGDTNAKKLKSILLRNKNADYDDADTPALHIMRSPHEGVNQIPGGPIVITADGIVIDYDFVDIVPDTTPRWQRRPLHAPLISRYMIDQTPKWTERGRVFLHNVPLPETEAGTLTDDTISAIAEKVKMELPNPVSIADQVWRTIFDATNNQPATQYPDRQVNTVAYFLKQAHDRIGINKTVIDNTKTEVDKIKADTTSLKTDLAGVDTKSTEIAAIKSQTDKMIFNSQNHIRMDERVINTEITTLSTKLSQVKTDLEGDIDNNENYLRPIQTTLNALTKEVIADAVWAISADTGFGARKTLKDVVNFLGINGIGNEELIDASDDLVAEKSLAVGYGIRDKAGALRYTKKAKTSNDIDTIPLSDDAVKLVREEK